MEGKPGGRFAEQMAGMKPDKAPGEKHKTVRYRCRAELTQACGLYRVGQCDGYYTWPAPACTAPNLADLTPTEKEEYREYKRLGELEELMALVLAREEGRLWVLGPCEAALCPLGIGEGAGCPLYREGCCAAREGMEKAEEGG